MKKPPQTARPEQENVELLKLEFQRKTFWWDWGAKVVAPVLAATIVALIGARVIADLKPIHLETGAVTFDPAMTDSSCICRNTVRKAFLEQERPIDITGQPCALSSTAVERNDRPDIAQPYYLTSDFEPRKSIGDRRCFREAVASVRQTFSQAPRVSLQIAWIDARTYDETDAGDPVLIGDGSGAKVQKGLNLRFDLQADRITKDGFDVKLRTWGDSRIYAAQVSYTAFIQ